MSTQLSLNHIDIKELAVLDDFALPQFLPIVNLANDLISGKVRELYLFGEQGSGKSHLLSAIHHKFNTTHQKDGQMAFLLSVKELLSTDPQMLFGMEQFSLILIDDLHLIAGHRDWQEAFFHLINRMRSRGHQLLFGATVPVRELDFSLLDLITRLSQALAVPMPDNDEPSERLALIQQYIKKRSLKIPPEVIDALANVGPHQIGDIIKVLDGLAPLLATNRLRGRISKKTLEEVKNAIIYQSFMIELSDVEMHYSPNYDDNLSLPL